MARGSALLYAFGTAITIATYSYFGGIGVRSHGSVLGFQAWLEIVTGIGLLAYAVTVRRSEVGSFLRKHRRIGAVAGLLSVLGYLAYLAAARELPFATVAAVRETSVVFGVAIGTLILKETFGGRRLLAAVLVAAGVMFLALASG
jgi:drug/metabolite transporter (DMT)-like permease